MKERAFLIVHGFAGDVNEIIYLKKYLERKGCDVYAPLLIGHGNGKKELKKYSWNDWIDYVKTSIVILGQDYEKISLIGFSMGGLLCAHSAGEAKLDKLVFINTPVYFWNFKVIFKDIITGIRTGNFKKINYYGKSILAASTKTTVDFWILIKKTVGLFEEIKRPLLILQCANDESVKPKSAQYIKDKVGQNAKLRYYHGGTHQVFIDGGTLRKKVCEDIYQFIKS